MRRATAIGVSLLFPALLYAPLVAAWLAPESARLSRSRQDPFPAHARLEELPQASVERVGDRRVVQYRGGLLPLVRLLDLLEPMEKHPAKPRGPERSESNHPTGPLQVLVHERNGARIGLEVEEILEIVEDDFEVDSAGGRPGIVGSTVIRGKATDLLDLPELLAHAAVSGFASPSAAAGA